MTPFFCQIIVAVVSSFLIIGIVSGLSRVESVPARPGRRVALQMGRDREVLSAPRPSTSKSRRKRGEDYCVWRNHRPAGKPCMASPRMRWTKGVARNFEVKSHLPRTIIIVHVAGNEMAQACVASWPELASKLSQGVLAGAAHVVATAQKNSSNVTADGETVGVRC